MKWFKHYSDASDGLSLKTLWANRDYEAIAVFWRLCEMLSKHNIKDGILVTNFSTIGRETGMKPSKCLRVLSRIASVSLVRYGHDTDEIQEFLVPNWLKFQETRGQKKVESFVKAPGEVRSKKREVRSKNIDIRDRIVDTKRSALVSAKKGSSNSRLIIEYVKAYELRYKARPVIDGRTQGLVKKILTTVPEDQACDMVQAFVQMNDPWFVKKAHDFPTFYENLTKVSMSLQTGQDHGAPPREKTLEELLAEDEKNGIRILPTTNK